jgi:glycosyltransferase involved in cell wall biosynthesis
MNILYVSYSGLGKGGAEVSLDLLMCELSKKHNVYVASSQDFPVIRTLLYKGFRLLPNYYIQNKYLEKFLVKQIKKYKIDIIHSNDRLTTIASITAAKKTGIPVVSHYRDYWFVCPKSSSYNGKKNVKVCSTKCLFTCSNYKRFLWDLYKLNYVQSHWKTLNQADVKIAISSTIKNKLELCKISNSVIVPNPVKLDHLERRKGNGDKVKVLFLGKLHKNKGIQNMLDIIDFDKVDFLVAGYGPLEEFVKQYPVKFLGWVDPKVAYVQADIVVVPSLWEEPFGRVVVEAMSFGIPVIASNLGGLKDIVIDGKTGYLVDPEDKIKWKEKILCLVDNPELREKMGNEALKEVKKYDIKVIANIIEEVYLKCVE